MSNTFNILDKDIPFLDESLIGNAGNYYPTRTSVRVFGRNGNVDNARLALWEGPTANYVPPVAAIQMKVTSTSAEDNSAGTGIQQLHIHYLDDTYTERAETVTLSGTTAVTTTAANILRVNSIHAWAVGSNGSAVGTISLTNLAGTVTYNLISPNRNTSRTGFYTVPAGHNLYISHWQSSSGSTGGHFSQMSLRATSHLGVLLPGVFTVIDEVGSQNSGVSVNFSTPIKIPATADVKISVVSDAVDANVIALGAFMGWVEHE